MERRVGVGSDRDLSTQCERKQCGIPRAKHESKPPVYGPGKSEQCGISFSHGWVSYYYSHQIHLIQEIRETRERGANGRPKRWGETEELEETKEVEET